MRGGVRSSGHGHRLRRRAGDEEEGYDAGTRLGGQGKRRYVANGDGLAIPPDDVRDLGSGAAHCRLEDFRPHVAQS